MIPTDRDHQQEIASASIAASDLAFGDIDLLFHAVQARLLLTVSAAYAAECAARHEDPAPRIREDVLECVAELNQLHVVMTDEVGRRRILERTIVDLRESLADSQLALMGTQAGEREARRLALHDGLTLLPNRDHFRGRLEQALMSSGSGSTPFAVMFLDLDHFKDINDTHGHHVGDAVLRIVAVRLAGGVRANDVVSRIGGDEFACLIPGVSDRLHLSHLVCKLFDSMSSPMQIGKLKVSVRPSIGVAMSPDDGAAPLDLLRHADAAMYRAKREHSGYAFFDRRVDTRAHDGAPTRLSGSEAGVELPIPRTTNEEKVK